MSAIPLPVPNTPDPLNDEDCPLSVVPPEVFLQIFLYLDLPDIAALAAISSTLATIAADPALQRRRLLVVAPSRLSHALFDKNPPRPTVGQLIQMNVLRGVGIERRWRTGMYLYSALSIKQYENVVRLKRMHTSNLLSTHLRRRPPMKHALLEALRRSRILPDVEYSSARVAHSLLPVMRRLKWSIQRDRLAKAVRTTSSGNITRWLEGQGRHLVTEGERVRLAVCPDIRRLVRIFEAMSAPR